MANSSTKKQIKEVLEKKFDEILKKLRHTKLYTFKEIWSDSLRKANNPLSRKCKAPSKFRDGYDFFEFSSLLNISNDSL